MPPLRIADYDTRKKFDLTKFLVLLTFKMSTYDSKTSFEYL